ncbi:MAG: hypothetical protein GF418_01710 [Chitinivibrionales bacterium]|nr:hypothetical protein [Chitinivibrionales bacterium]MBD3394318.1 hypothetical protein [Chitinivibrionales bacterium]
MELDFMIELEQKIDALIQGYKNLKQEKENIASEINTKDNKIQELEGENHTLREQLTTLKDTSADRQKKLEAAASRVTDLISKLETVE